MASKSICDPHHGSASVPVRFLRRRFAEAKERTHHRGFLTRPRISRQLPTLRSWSWVWCAGPLLVGALIRSGVGGWLATHGFLLGGWAAFVVAAVLAGGPGCGTCRDDCRLFTVDRYEHGGRSGWLPRRVRRN